MDAPHNGLPLTFPLWEKNTPLAGEALPGLPRLTVYLPSEECRTVQAVIICPGGGYGMLSVPKEGHRIARFLSSHGHVAAVLENRYAPYRHPAPLIDAQRAIRTLRHHALDWLIDSDQIGAEASPELVKQLSLENAVTDQTPPTLLIHTNEDEGVPPENSILFYQALRKNKVPAELHIYEKEGHGIGLAENHPWGAAMLQWMGNRTM